MDHTEFDETVPVEERGISQRDSTSSCLAMQLSSVQDVLEKTKKELIHFKNQWEAAQSKTSRTSIPGEPRELCESECLAAQFEHFKAELKNELSEVKLRVSASDLDLPKKYSQLLRRNKEMQERLLVQDDEMGEAFSLYQKEVEARDHVASKRELALTQQLNKVLHEALKKENSMLIGQLKEAKASADLAKNELRILRNQEIVFKEKLFTLEINLEKVLGEKNKIKTELEALREMTDHLSTADKVSNAEQESESEDERISALEGEKKVLITKLEEVGATFSDLKMKLDNLTQRLELQQVNESSATIVETAPRSTLFRTLSTSGVPDWKRVMILIYFSFFVAFAWSIVARFSPFDRANL